MTTERLPRPLADSLAAGLEAIYTGDVRTQLDERQLRALDVAIDVVNGLEDEVEDFLRWARINREADQRPVDLLGDRLEELRDQFNAVTDQYLAAYERAEAKAAKAGELVDAKRIPFHRRYTGLAVRVEAAKAAHASSLEHLEASTMRSSA